MTTASAHPEPTPSPSGSGPTPPPRRPWWRRWSFRRTLDAAVGAVVGLQAPRRFRKGVPGTQSGIEPEELTKLPTQPGAVHISCIDYSPERVVMQDIADIEDFIIHHRPDWATVRWINVDGLSDMNVIQALAIKYRLHPLAIEDLIHVPQRPKVDPYPGEGDYQARLFIIARMIQLRDNRLHGEQVSIFAGHKTVLTFQETRGDVWNPIRQRINTKGSRLRNNDASFLVYALLDAVVDHCFPILEYYGDRLHDLEEAVLENPNADVVQRMHELNRELMLLRRQVWPMRDVILQLQREEHECMGDMARTYLRDVYDHVVQIIDMIETYREIAASITETYATFMGNKLNEVVKVLTVVTVIFTPPMFLASVYGMNFEVFPELKLPYGYVLFWVVSILSSVGMVYWFKRRGWL